MTLYRVSNFSLGKQKESEVLKVCINFNLKIFSEGVSHQKLGFWGLSNLFFNNQRKIEVFEVYMNLSLNKQNVKFLRFYQPQSK